MDDSGFDSDPKQLKTNEDEQLFPVSDSSSSSATTIHSTPKKSNRRELHKKLERRIEQAKKIQNFQDLKKNSPLIPIQRLQIPSSKSSTASNSTKEHHPLVDWDSDESEEDINFFPASRLRDSSKQELTDTFSIEEFEVTPDDEDDLDLLPPKSMSQRLLCCNLPLPTWKCVIL
ncbi:uncharacterized protein LOC142322092 [Lycorma delicatula]|uniref:uncharacterized protein LOC142322092 n=1 Tax=Lycorma delicatula TaxID=130591 RepID=UPI003F51509E